MPGRPKFWQKGVAAIKQAADKVGMVIYDRRAKPRGCPKLDFIFRMYSSVNGSWARCRLILLPERFDLEYTGEDGLKHRPVMIHRAPFGAWNVLLVF